MGGAQKYILNIETSGDVCAVAVGNSVHLLSKTELFEKNIHSKMLGQAATDTINEAGINHQELSAIAISLGPGSFTGLRIGMSFAKGMAFALKIPIIGISTLKLVAESGSLLDNRFENIMAIIDARREEVFFAQYHRSDDSLVEIKQPGILAINQLKEFVKGNATIFAYQMNFDNNHLFNKMKANFKTLDSISLDAMNSEANRRLENEKFDDLDGIEPLYLRKFAGYY